MQKVGILGGGQLARMLVLSAHKLGLEPHVLCQNSNEPAAQVTSNVHLGSSSNEAFVRDFLSKMELATFESEFIDSDLVQNARGLCQVFPNPTAIGLIQDRRTQKSLLEKYKIPTLPWFEFIPGRIDEIKDRPDLVIKKRRFGYDGLGTFHLPKSSTVHLPEDPLGYIAEPRLKFDRELAFLAARSSKGDMVFFPLVEHQAANSRLLWAKGPVKNSSLTKLQNLFKKMLRELDYVGVLGVELFEAKGKLWVNELAPRVHNTGHYSMDALDVDQFTMHWLCGLGAKISTPLSPHKGFAVFNLLGSSTETPSWSLTAKDIYLHWYGKSENRPGRKMGHINATGSSPDLALKKVLAGRKFFKL